MWIVKLRRDGRAAKRGSESWVTAATAARLMAEGEAAVVVGAAENETSTTPAPPDGDTEEEWESASLDPVHLFVLSPAVLAVQTASGRRRLHRYPAGEDVCLNSDQFEITRTLLRLGCATRELPPPSGRDSLVRFDQTNEVAGLTMVPGTVAALDFDPLSVIPELRGLGLYPWHILDIENLGDDGCQGQQLEFVRLVVRLKESWHPFRAAGFLSGVFVDTTYRDYRRQPPSGRVLRAYATHGDQRPPFAVLAAPESGP